MYDVYISNTLLPIAPEKITTQINGKNETATLINDGEVSILKSPGLTTVSFIALFPNVKYPFAQYPDGYHAAGYYLNKLEALMNKKPFQFIVTRKTPKDKKLFNTNLTVSLENYQIIDDAREGMDIKVQINLKQFKDYGTKTFTVEKPSPTAPTIVNPRRIESTAPSKSGSSGGGGKGGSGGGKTKTYKVCIPGMSTLSIKATSVQAAITKAAGTWTGDIIVDGTTYYVVKGKISQRPANKTTVPATVKKVVDKVKTTVKKVADTVKTVVTKVTDFFKKATTPKTTTKVIKPAAKNLGNKLMLKK